MRYLNPFGDGPFTRAEALAAGLTPDRLRTNGYRQVFRNVHVSAEAPDSLQLRAAAIMKVAPKGSVVSGRTAAWLHGVNILDADELLTPEITLPRETPMGPRKGLVVRRALVPQSDITEVAGLAVLTPMRAAFDLARRQQMREALVAVDAFAKAGLVDLSELVAYSAEHVGWRGIRQVPQVVKMAEPLTESPMESRLRYVVVVTGGLPPPEVQIEVVDVTGYPFARIDMGYRKQMVGLEYDGQDHRERWEADLHRERTLRLMGWQILRFTAVDVYRRPWIVVQTVAQALRRS